jgi:hypothetical protein
MNKSKLNKKSVIQHDPNWLIELLEQNRSIHIHDGLGTFIRKTDFGWEICGREDVINSLDKKIFNDLSAALESAKSLHNIFLNKQKISECIACVQHNDGWCACAGKSIRYRDHVKTKCNHWITLPLGLEFRQPTCTECIEMLSK